LNFKIEDIIVADNYITIRTVMTGTQRDSLFGLPPTNKPIHVNQINIEKIKDGKISEHWRVTDELTMMKQLGVVQ
jgi:predicted ester cyclase